MGCAIAWFPISAIRVAWSWTRQLSTGGRNLMRIKFFGCASRRGSKEANGVKNATTENSAFERDWYKNVDKPSKPGRASPSR